jgi:serine/threonine protein phosphatase PrpC
VGGGSTSRYSSHKKEEGQQ